MKKSLTMGVFFVMTTLASAVQSQTAYDSKTLVDTNNTSNSTSTVTSNNTNNNVTTSTSTSAVNSTSVNTNNNVSTSTNVNTNHNINSGTQTINNNNHNTGEVTYRNINTGESTNRNINTSVSASTSNNTNTNISASENTNRNINTGDMTNRNISTSTSNSDNKNTNISTSDNVNRNIQTGDMTNRNINESTVTQKVIQPPPTAIAPAMMSGGNNDLCSTGTSGSVQTQILGVSSGGTVRDLNCERLKLSKTLFDMGMKVAAVATMCQDRRVFDAMMAAGTPCPYEGKIGEAAKELWAANPDKVPSLERPKADDTFKKVGIGSLLGILIYTIFGH